MAECPGVLGLKVVFEGSNPCVDIVAVHGLGASPDWAWIREVEDGNKEVYVNWLADEGLLPTKVPDSRIMTFNYESKWLLRAPKQRRSLCAIQLLTALDNKRKQEKDTKYRPLIFIGHSFGGVVVEQSLVSANSHESSFHYLCLSTVGIVFLGTPHRGTPVAKWGEIVARSAKALGFGSEDSILRDLREDSETSKDLLYEFTLWANKASLTLFCFFEQHQTDCGKRFGGTWKEMVVDETSACIDGCRKVPLPTDHLKINKYSGPDDPSYIAVYPLIVDVAQKAVRIVQDRLNPRVIVEDSSGIDNKHSACLQALFYSNPLDDLAATRSAKGERVPGTCEWILTQGPYTLWLLGPSPQLLWLSGGPGIGKTMISSFLVEELVHLSERSSRMTLAYYFCDDKDDRRRTATAILRGLLLQILRQRPTLFEYLQHDFDESGPNLFTNFHALWRVFICTVDDERAGEVYCLIDALDECEEESRRLFLIHLKRTFGPQRSQRRFVKFIITSRWQRDIEESLSASSPATRDLRIDSGRVNGDLSKFIEVKVDELSTKKRYSVKLKDKIKRVLIDRAGGTFLYVSLVLDDLNRTILPRLVEKKLRELPSDLNKLYDKILSQIDVDCQEIARSVLSWVAVARRPLTVKELAMALFLESGEWKEDTEPSEDLLEDIKADFECCEPLVQMDTYNNTVNLVHQSAKEYLLGEYLQKSHNLSQYHVVTDWTNLLIFRTCWTYLSLEEFKQGTVIIERHTDHQLYQKFQSEQFLDDHCLLRYASQEWQEHALAAIQALATSYEFRKESLDRLPTLRDTWLLRGAAEGQGVVVQRLLENGAELESKNRMNRTPLSLAAAGGHEAVVKLLLYRDDVAADSRNVFGQTPLLFAAEEGHEAVVKLLLRRDDVAVDSRDESGRTPLSYAAEGGHEAVVKLLLYRNDVAADSRNDYGRTPLSYAAAGGHEAVVKLLLHRDDMAADSRDIGGRTPLSYAAARGHEAVVKLLLSRDDVAADSRDESGLTPLSYAAARGHEAIVKMLKEKMRDKSSKP